MLHTEMSQTGSMTSRIHFILVLFLSVLVLNGCVAAALTGATTGGVWATQERSVGNAIDDAGIIAQINSKYVQKHFDDLFRSVNIKVHEGRVLLTGIVPNAENKKDAEELAWQVAGVKEVINELEVSKDFSYQGYVSDSWINTEIAARLLADKHIHSVNYSVNTVNGTVYILGIAQDKKELMSVAETISKIKGVKRVVGHVRLKDDAIRKASLEPKDS